MFIKGRLKLIRKYDCDFWNLTYYKVKKNRFFNYFKHSLISKVKQATRGGLIKFITGSKRQIPLLGTLGFCSNQVAFFSPFFGDEKKKLVTKMGYKNIKKFFRNRNPKYVNYIYRRCFFRKEQFFYDLLLGIKSNYSLYKPIRRTPFEEKKIFFRQITLFYNDFDTIKLRRFGRLGRKTQCGGVNYFLFLLESRIDSIVLRLNLANKFIVREIIKAKKILVDGKAINYSNFIVKKFSFVTFKDKYLEDIYKILKKKILTKKFFVQPPFYFEINYRTFIILIIPKLMDPSFVPYPFFSSRSSLVTGLHTVLWGW